jgi:MerR family transcriptional regulator, light-induced transcriptional regulator
MLKKRMAHYSIKDLEELSGIKAHTIRIWEKRYKLIEPERTCTNIRLYDDEDLKKLLNVSMLNRNGWKISRLAELDNEKLTEMVLQLSKEASDSETQIENLIVSMLDLDESKFEKILSNSILKIGFEDTLTKVVYPFFERIGVLWLVGSINAAQEHFVSNLMRQKLIAAIDGQLPGKNDRPKTFMLFLHEAELHELGLLFYNYILRKHGHKVIYLGQAVPFKDLIQIADIQNIDVLFTSFTTGISEKDLQNYLQKLSEQFPKHEIIITGYQTNKAFSSLPSNLLQVHSVSHFREILSERYS